MTNRGAFGAVGAACGRRMQEVEVGPGPAGEGRPIGDVRGGAIIVGVRDPSGLLQPQPAARPVLRAGDVVAAVETERATDRLDDLFAPAGTRARS